MNFSNKYIIGFSLAICLVCSLLVAGFAVGLKSKQVANKRLDQQRNLVIVAGLVSAEEELSAERVQELFRDIETLKIERRSGALLGPIEFGSYDPIRAAKDPARSSPSDNAARVSSLPNELIVYHVKTPGRESYIFPIWGNGLWSTLYGYLAVKPDFNEIIGLTYYEHGETPGLGGEVDNPTWKSQWHGKRMFDEQGNIAVQVVKQGTKGNVNRDPHLVDGITGATITSTGVTKMLQLWLGEHGYGPFLKTRGKS